MLCYVAFAPARRTQVLLKSSQRGLRNASKETERALVFFYIHSGLLDARAACQLKTGVGCKPQVRSKASSSEPTPYGRRPQILHRGEADDDLPCGSLPNALQLCFRVSAMRIVLYLDFWAHSRLQTELGIKSVRWLSHVTWRPV